MRLWYYMERVRKAIIRYDSDKKDMDILMMKRFLSSSATIHL